MMERLNPLNDYIFKRIMEDAENLIAFLNAVLEPNDQKKLVSLEVIDNKELTKEFISDKTGRLDVRAKTADGMQINIEVQLTNQNNMEKRTIFYWGKLFLEGIKQGEDYFNLAKVITVNLLDFDYLKHEKFHTKFHLWEDQDKDFLLTDLMEIHFVELPKFERLAHKNYREVPLHRWLRFLNKATPEQELKELSEMDNSIKRAEEKLELLSSDAETIALYKAREEALHERANMINSAKEAGREEGRMEERVEMARNMLREGFSIEVIAKMTKLAENDIGRLQDELKNLGH